MSKGKWCKVDVYTAADGISVSPCSKYLRGRKLLSPPTDKVEVTEKQLEVAESEGVLAAADGNVTENTIVILLDFKIKEVC